MLKLPDSQRYVFRVQTTLARAVILSMQRKVELQPDVWKTEPKMQTVSVPDMPAKVTDAILEQTEAFVLAYLTANPPGAQPSRIFPLSVEMLRPQRLPGRQPNPSQQMTK